MAIAKDLSGNSPATGAEPHIPDPHNPGAGSGGNTSVKATAAAPTYLEASTTNPLSTDLAGNLRVTGGSAPTVKSTAAAPSYSEGATTNPFSSDLLGNLRITGNTTGVKATAAAPTYTEGVATNPFSVDLAGNLRVVGNTNTTLKSTAVAPTYTEGTLGNPLSSDLKGRVRVGITGPTGLDVDFSADAYETVAASQSDQVMGATGAAGDILDGVLIIPGTTAAGAVSIKDGGGSAISIFAGGGTTALLSLIPFFVPLGITSVSGAWKVTTGANVTAIGVGKFT